MTANPMPKRVLKALSASSTHSLINSFRNKKQQQKKVKKMNRGRSLAANTLVTVLLALTLIGCSADPEKGKAKYLQSGMGHMQKGRYQEAAIQFRNALKLDPRFVDAYYQLAQVSLALHQW